MGGFISRVFCWMRFQIVRPILFIFFWMKLLKEKVPRNTVSDEEKMWNSWGNIVDFENQKRLPEDAEKFLEERVGESTAWEEVPLEDVCSDVQESRLPAWDEEEDGIKEGLISVDEETRVRHSRGQSCADWLNLKGGNIDVFPDGVAFPEANEDVRSLIEYAKNNKVMLIPYGGGTSVVGHINPPQIDQPILTVSLRKMKTILVLNRNNNTATFQAGATGQEVEDELANHGYVWGHRPQCFDYATLGGFVSCRSSGQESLKYGRIEKLVRGVRMETSGGTVFTGKTPVTSAGPDLPVFGHEGRAGIITEVTLKISREPEKKLYSAAFLPDWSVGLRCCKSLMERKKLGEIPLSMLRISNSTETETNLRLSLDKSKFDVLDMFLGDGGCGKDRVMLVFGLVGSKSSVKLGMSSIKKVFRQYSAITTIGSYMGHKWQCSRFKGPYKREHVWQKGYAIDTVETCTDWGNIERLTEIMENTITETLDKEEERVLVFSHCSHFYSSGSCIYTTFAFRVDEDYQKTFDRWRRIKTEVSAAIVENGGTISDHHGVGKDHAPYMEAEIGKEGMKLMKASFEKIDPLKIFNAKTLFE